MEEENRALKEQLEEQERNFMQEIDLLGNKIVEDAEMLRKQKILLKQYLKKFLKICRPS